MSVLSLTGNPIIHATTKHVAASYHFVKERAAEGSINVRHVSHKNQLADILTKPLPRDGFSFLRGKLMTDPHQLGGGGVSKE